MRQTNSRAKYLIPAMLAAVMALAPAAIGASTRLRSAREVRANGSAIGVPSDGRYTLWIWAQGGRTYPVRLGANALGETRTGDGEAFGWAKVGAADLKAGEKYPLGIGANDAETSTALHHQVGYVLLSTHAECRPDALFELGRVNPRAPDAVTDPRVTEFRHTDKTYDPVAYESKEQWQARASDIRRQILVANGLWPMPERTPLNAQRFGRIDHEDYSIEKVHFESFPGFFATGNLYLPRGKQGPYPAILNPHGHWREGRLVDGPDGSVIARCISFARQGCVAFAIDMVGYNDSSQLKHTFASPLWGVSLMGLQTWNNVRALDFLESLPEVDRERIGCTGASGGGTQTFILTAIDDRVRCAVPVCMVSAHFQGGCECENAPLLRLHAYNVEIAASAGPRPYMLTGATGDWTKNLLQVEGPAVKKIYDLLGAGDRFHYAIVDAGHNYNKETREHVYRWMGKWLLNETHAELLSEKPYTADPKENMLVFTEAHPRPSNALDEAGIRAFLIERSRRQLEATRPRDAATRERFGEVYGEALRRTLGVAPVDPESVEVARDEQRIERDRYRARRYKASRAGGQGRVPALVLTPGGQRPTRAVVLVHPRGRMGLLDPESGEPTALVLRLLEQGCMVVAPDCFLTEAWHSPFAETQRALPPRYPYTYNLTTLAWRVQDILTVWVGTGAQFAPSDVALVGVGEAGPWCLLAAAVGGMKGAPVIVDANGFADDEASWQGEMVQPNILNCGGLKAAAALVAPSRLLLHNTQGRLDADWVGDAYKVAGAAEALRIERERLADEAIAAGLAE